MFLRAARIAVMTNTELVSMKKVFNAPKNWLNCAWEELYSSRLFPREYMNTIKNRENTSMSPKMNSQIPASPGKWRAGLPGALTSDVDMIYKLKSKN